jgi:hypothetical protein
MNNGGDPKGFDFPFDQGLARVLVHAALDTWDVQYKARYLAMLAVANRLGVEITAENDFIKALATTDERMFQIQFEEHEFFVYVHALNALDNPSEYPRRPKVQGT